MQRVQRKAIGRQHPAAYTLLELIISSSAATILIAGMVSAVVMSGKALTLPAEHKAVLEAADVSHVIADELQSAIRILDYSDTYTRFAVAAPDAADQSEVIGYEWHAEDGQLIRTRGDASGILADSLSDVSLQPIFQAVPEELAGRVSQTSEQVLADVTSGGNLKTRDVSVSEPCGQYLDAPLPVNTVAWSITEVELLLRRQWWYARNEKLFVQIRQATGDGMPTSVVLGQGELDVSELSTSWEWTTIGITGADRLLSSQRICIVVMADESVFGQAGRVGYTTKKFTSVGHMLWSSDYGASWNSRSSRSLYFRLRGTRIEVDNSTHQVTRNYIVGYDIRANADTSGSQISRRVRLLNAPEDVSDVWRLDFNRLPTAGVDSNLDGQNDWVVAAGGTFHPQISGSRMQLQAGQFYRTAVASSFSGLITADFHCRAEATSSIGAFLVLPFSESSSRFGLITARVFRTTDGLQTAMVVAQNGSQTQLLALVNGLPDEQVELRIVVDPVADEAAIWVNEIFQGRSNVAQPLSGSSQYIFFGAADTTAEFDFLSVRVGRSM